MAEPQKKQSFSRIVQEWINPVFSNRRQKIFFIVFLAIISSLIIAARKPDTITHPEFYAEDGGVWFADAYNISPIWSQFKPEAGYLQTISRFGAALSLPFGIQNAPLIFNFLAIAVQILPVLFLFSKRFDRIFPNYLTRILIASVYLLLPHSLETHANLTNAQWRLAILMFMIIVAETGRSRFWRYFDYAVLFIGGLSGPFSILLVPVILLHQKYSKDKKPIELAIIASTGLIQLGCLAVTFYATRSQSPLGANFFTFFKILTGNVLIGGLIGSDNYQAALKHSFWARGYVIVLGGIFLVSVFFYTFRRAFLELKLFIVFALIIFLAAMATPQVSLKSPQWANMILGGNRYYLIPILAWIFSLGWLAKNSRSKILKYSSGALLAVLILVGIPSDFKLQQFTHYDLKAQVREFDTLDPGARYDFHIYPEGWTMSLIKK